MHEIQILTRQNTFWLEMTLTKKNLISVNLVYSLVLKMIRSHSSRVFLFLTAVSSPSAAPTTGILKIANSCVLLVGQPYKAQLEPTILFSITLKV
jgi:hypothetical protein